MIMFHFEDMSQKVSTIFHVDMDAFFASIEQRNNPALRGKPIIVGGSPKGRGVVAAASYEARKFGIRSAMSAGKALKLCPNLIIVNGNYSAYSTASNQIMAIFDSISPRVETISIDEAFLDMTGLVTNDNTVLVIAEKIKALIKTEINVTCSIGVAPNKLIAKIASDMNKPDGITIINPDEINLKIYPLPVEKLWGVGPVTLKYLHQEKVYTIGDLANMKSGKLKTQFGKIGEWLKDRAAGIDKRTVSETIKPYVEKSMSHRMTLNIDTSNIEELEATLLALADKVVMRLIRGGWLARTTSVRIRYSDFQTITRDHTFAMPTNSLEVIYAACKKLIPKDKIKDRQVRMIGCRVCNLLKTKNSLQLELLEDDQHNKTRTVANVVRDLRDKYGEEAIMRGGSLLGKYKFRTLFKSSD